MQQWLYLVARTVVADHWRTFYRMPTNSLDELLEEGWEGPAEIESISRGNEQEKRVRYILQALPERYRQVLTCRFLLNLSIKDTALKMGVTEANAKILQYRALKRAADVELTINDQLYQAL